MGGFALLKIRSRKASLLSKTRTPATPADKAIKHVAKPDSVVKPDNCVVDDDALNKAPVLPGMLADADATDSSSGSTEVSTIVTYESSNDDSTLSSIHSDSLTSFMGNLSPPKIEFTDKRLEELLPPTKHSPSTMCRGILKKNRSAPNERKSAAFAENLETKIRSSPAAFNVGLSERSSRSKSHAPSENLGKMEAQARNAIVTMVEEKLSSSGRSKTDVAPRPEKQPTSCNRSKIDAAPDKETVSARKTGSLEKARPAKKKGLATSRSKPDTAIDKEDSSNRRDSPTRKASPVKKTTAALRSIKTTILRPSSSPETVTPTILASEFKLMEDFEPTVEIGEEVNDDENTVLTMEVLEGVLEGIETNRSDDAGCDLLGNLFDCDATVANQKKVAGDEGEEGTTMISLFDDEGNEFLFEKREGEDIGIVATSTTSSDRSGCDTRVSNKVGTEIKFRNKYQDGSVVKHLGALYKVKKQCSGDSSRLVMRKVENEEVNLVVGGMEAETCRKASRDVESSRGSKDDSGRDGSGSKGSSKESKGSEGTKGSRGSKGRSANPKPNRTTSKSSKGSKGQKKVAVRNQQCLHSKSDATSEADDSRWLDDDDDPKNHEKVAPRNQQYLRSKSDATSEADDSRWLDDGDPDLFRC